MRKVKYFCDRCLLEKDEDSIGKISLLICGILLSKGEKREYKSGINAKELEWCKNCRSRIIDLIHEFKLVKKEVDDYDYDDDYADDEEI